VSSETPLAVTLNAGLRGDDRADGFDQVDALHIFVKLGHPRPADVAEQLVLNHRANDDIGRRIGNRFLDGRNEELYIEKDMQQQREHENEAGQWKEPEGHARKVGEPLDGRETGLERGVFQQEKLKHSLAPARPLTDERFERLRLQARRQWLIDIDAAPTGAMQFQSRLAVLGDGDAREPVGRLERRSPQQRGRTAKERPVPLVEPTLGDRIEHFVLGRHVVEGPQVSLDRVSIQEHVRGLHEKQLRIGEEIADRFAKERLERHVIGVEHDHHRGDRMRKTVIQVSGLCMLVTRRLFTPLYSPCQTFTGLQRCGWGTATYKMVLLPIVYSHCPVYTKSMLIPFPYQYDLAM